MSTNLAYQDYFEEEEREELIGGKIMLMSPRPAFNHNRVASRIFWIFENYLNKKRCIAIADGTDLYLTEEDRFIPDMMVVCDRDKIRRKGVYGAPDLVVEVLSPGTARNDKGYKKNKYESSGVAEYWIVDPWRRSIEVYLLQDGRYALDNIYTLCPAEELAEMTDEEKAVFVTEFTCHLYDDLIIRLEDIFTDLF